MITLKSPLVLQGVYRVNFADVIVVHLLLRLLGSHSLIEGIDILHFKL